MASTAFVVLVLAVLVGLGRPPGRLTADALPLAALSGVLVLQRLTERRRARLQVLAPAVPDR